MAGPPLIDPSDRSTWPDSDDELDEEELKYAPRQLAPGNPRERRMFVSEPNDWPTPAAADPNDPPYDPNGWGPGKPPPPQTWDDLSPRIGSDEEPGGVGEGPF